MKIWNYNFPPIGFEGWAKIILREDGFFAAVSDYGNYAYLWTHHGEDDFRKFFLKVNSDYIMSKLNPKKEINIVKSFENIKQYILRNRRERSYNAYKARSVWNEVFEYEYDDDWDGFCRHSEHINEPWEFTIHEYPSDVRAFAENIVCKRLRNILSEELEKK